MAEKRIIVVIAEKVQTSERGVVMQVPGRMSAQGGHASGRTRLHLMATIAIQNKNLRTPEFRELLHDVANEKVTTIHLSCRDSNELDHVKLLLHKAKIRHFDFFDKNPDVYGPGEVRTALATVPVEPDDLVGITDYLPLWTP